MENTLGGSVSRATRQSLLNLNPCSNGRYSRSVIDLKGTARTSCLVLILVLMEDTLGASRE